jgi:uncharacterized membrane protein YraQ (UPF0718 family)
MTGDATSAQQWGHLDERRRDPPLWPTGLVLLLVIGGAALLGQRMFIVLVGDNAAIQTWSTILVAIMVQALPFLGLGVAVSGAIAAFVPATVFERVLPRRPGLAVPVAGAAGAVLPGSVVTDTPSR